MVVKTMTITAYETKRSNADIVLCAGVVDNVYNICNQIRIELNKIKANNNDITINK